MFGSAQKLLGESRYGSALGSQGIPLSAEPGRPGFGRGYSAWDPLRRAFFLRQNAPKAQSARITDATVFLSANLPRRIIALNRTALFNSD